MQGNSLQEIDINYFVSRRKKKKKTRNYAIYFAFDAVFIFIAGYSGQ